jgi:ankyrin repeat protein
MNNTIDLAHCFSQSCRAGIVIVAVFFLAGCGDDATPTAAESDTTKSPAVQPKKQNDLQQSDLPQPENIWAAVSQGNLKAVQEFLDSGVDVNGTFVVPGVPGSGGTPLHIAAISDQVEIANLLVFKGAHVDAKAKDKHGGTPLHWAAFFGKTKMVRMLIDCSAKLDSKDNHGFTPLDATLGQSSKAKQEVAKILKKAGATSSLETASAPDNSIWNSAATGDLAAVKGYIDSGTDINKKNATGSTALGIAAFFGHADVAGLLIDDGAKINVQDSEGSTPLFLAAFFGRPETLKLLVDKGADLSILNNDGLTALSSVSGTWNEDLESLYTGLGKLLQVEIDIARLKKVRTTIIEILKEAEQSSKSKDATK